ncbi:MAG TPA: trypsin-like serine protease [Polyangiaceae bacterium]|jgi:hypothetical protein
MKLLFAAALASCAMGCAMTPPHLSLAAKLRIEDETTLWDVRAGRARPGDANVRVLSRDGLCSGVLIGDALVLTAQHCVTASEPGAVRVELGGDYLPWGRAGVVAVVGCPGWDSDAGRDVAVLVLERRVPADVPRYEPRLGAPVRDGERVRVVGFGTGSDVWELPGTGGWALQSARSARDGETTLVLGDRFYLSARAQHGDSGGAVLSLEDGDVVGVLSEKQERATGDDDDGMSVLAAGLAPCAGAIARARALAP